MVITCMNKKAKIKSNSIQNIMNHDAHLHAEEGEDRVKLPPDQHVDHLHEEEGEV